MFEDVEANRVNVCRPCDSQSIIMWCASCRMMAVAIAVEPTRSSLIAVQFLKLVVVFLFLFVTTLVLIRWGRCPGWNTTCKIFKD